MGFRGVTRTLSYSTLAIATSILRTAVEPRFFLTTRDARAKTRSAGDQSCESPRRGRPLEALGELKKTAIT